MKKTLLGSALFSLSLIGSLCAEHYEVYLLGGQSNGNGRADAAQLVAPLDAAQTDVRFYWHRTQAADNVGWLLEDEWIDLAPGSGHGTGLPVYDVEFGPEVSFGRAMADAKPTENIAIIKYTHGGTTLHNHWSATGTQYTTFVPTVEAALSALTTAGHTYELRGMLWVQGETDSNTATGWDNYQTNLTNLITRVRTDLNSGQAFPFVLSTLSDSQYANITTVGSGPYKVRQAQETVAAANPTVGIVITDGYSVRSDVIHFDHTALVTLGENLATQMLALEAPTTTSLIHHWTFDGDATDSVGSANGVLEGGAGYAAGQFGQAISLDGVDDAVQAGGAIVPATDYTLTAWVYWENGNGHRGTIAGGQVSGSSGEVFTMSRDTDPDPTDRKLFLNLLPNGGPSITESPDNTLSDVAVWQHVAYSVSSTAGVTLYLDGAVVATNPTLTTHTPSTLNNFTIGRRPDSTTTNPGWFDGLIDDVAIFDGVLDSSQLTNVIAQGAQNFSGWPVGVTGVFDENVDATNELDIEIPASSLGPFKTSVLDAYNNDLGGVIDWETGVTATASSGATANNNFTSVAAAYGVGGGSVVSLTFDRPMELYTNDINGQVSVLSRQGTQHNALIPAGGNDPIGLDYSVAFTGADIIELGMAVPSRSTYGALGVDFRATATYSGGSPTIVDFTVGGTPETSDTFLHFTAPVNETITSVFVEYVDDNGQSLANGQRRPVLDDLGFVVAAPTISFADWIGGFSGLGGQTAFSDDPDSDGNENGLEAWFGTHPGEFSAGIAQVATDGTITSFTHPQNESPPSDLTGYYEWSPNLLDWYAGDGSDGPGGGPTVTISPNTVGTTTTVTATASEALDRLFLRAGVLQD